MAKFKAKPLVVEAVRWRGYSSNLGITTEAADQPVEITADNMGGIGWEELPTWLPPCLDPLPSEALTRNVVQKGQIRRFGENLFVGTVHGIMVAEPGDWIVYVDKGDLCPCKPDVFAEMYELVVEKK